jgi:response regulator RpfG family c-di-GMP phosphodiesterase
MSDFDNDMDLLFSDETPDEKSNVRAQSFYKILIVDDEEEVHNLTKLVLRDYTFEGRGLKFLDAYSASEAKVVLEQSSDIAVILLDVVMESDYAGLELVKDIRLNLRNRYSRIILRTGQPGQAPENDVIANYDINDYKEKSELTSSKLFTTITASLRSYRDIVSINESRKGLRSVIDATGSLFEPTSLSKLSEGILKQLHILFNLYDGSSILHASSFAATHDLKSDYTIVSATGEYSSSINRKLSDTLSADIYEKIISCNNEDKNMIIDDKFIACFKSSNGKRNIVYLEGVDDSIDFNIDIIKLFSRNVDIAFDNLFLNQEVLETQKSIVYTLVEVVERRSNETGNHVRRMTEISCLIGSELGLGHKNISLLRLAAPLHDIGKIGIADAILHKPGKLTEEEYATIKTHPLQGYEILKGNERVAMKMAALIAYQHHEKWDGTGYPQGLKGEEIDLYARITALADVVDALGNKRSYKDSWSLDRILEFIEEQRGKHFDPLVVDAFLNRLDQYRAICERFK